MPPTPPADSAPPQELRAALAAAALLGEFDAPLLDAAAGLAGAFDSLAAAGLLRPAAAPGASALAPGLGAGPREADADAAALERALAHLAGREPTPEEAVFQLFDRLMALLLRMNDWEAAARGLAAARAAAPQGERPRQRIALYAGYLAVQVGEVAAGRAELEALLAGGGLDFDTGARALLGLAQSHWTETRYDLALETYRRLRELAAAQGDRLYEGLALINMANAYNELELYEQAIELCGAALPLFRAIGDGAREAHAIYRIGLNALHLGRWDLAREHFAPAIARFEELGMHGGLAMLHWAEGFLHHMLGDAARSEAGYRRALALAERPGQPDHTVAIDAALRLGLLFQTEGRWGEALDAYDDAERRALALDRHHLVGQIRYRRGAALERSGRPDEALAAYRSAADAVERLRSATEEESIKIGLLGTTQQIYESAVLLLLARGEVAEAFEYVERARSRAFLDQLARRSPELYGAFDGPVAPLAEVQAALPEGALLLEYFAAGVLPQAPGLLANLSPEQSHLREHLTVPPQLWAFAVTAGSVEAVRLPVDPNRLRPDPRAPVPTRHMLRERMLPWLYDALLRPLEGALAGRRLLFLVPHGPLHYVPFAALRDSAGSSLLRAGGPALALAPRATVLVRSCLAPPPRAGGPFMAIGYNDAGDLELAYAEPEARLVAARTGGVALAGPGPKRAELAAAAPGLGGLHISGHAFFDPDDPLASEVHLGEGERLTARDIMADLRLGADLVVMSACAGGLSLVASGDELLGLQRALLHAGARTVVCSQWETTDLTAMVLVDHFYRALAGGAPPAAALRDAQVALREMTGRDLAATLARWRAEDSARSIGLGALPDVPPELLDTPIYADPFHWAPFTLVGRPS